jgi:membrane protease YdiL (CAAX protease family)
LGAVACLIAASFVYIVVALQLGRLSLGKPIPAQDAIYAQLVAYAALLPYLLYFLPRVSHTSLAGLGLKAPTWRQVGIGVAATLAMFVAVNVTSAIIASVTHLHDTEEAVQLLQQVKTPAEKLLFIAIAAILAPIVEELAFRAFLFNAFARYAPAGAAAVLSGILFGLVHATSKQQIVTVAIPLALGGIVLALVYRYSRCYWSNVITHGLFNSISLVAVFGFHVKS